MAGRITRARGARRVGASAVAGAVALVAAACIPPKPPTATTTTTTAVATVSGVVFTDDFADGDRDAGDAGLGGWTVAAYPAVGGEVSVETATATTTTAADGSYSLSLAPGEYVICETLPSFVNALDEWHQSGIDNSVCAAVDDIAPHGHAVTVGSASITDLDFANFQNHAVGYWFGRDADGDGEHDGVAPVPTGQTVDLYEDLDVDGIADADEPLAYTKAADGGAGNFYAYASLQQHGIRPGHYVACQRLVAGQTQQAPANTACAAVSDAPGGFPLIAGSGGGGNDNFFIIGPGMRTITGTVRDDIFAVRVRNASAPVTLFANLASWTIQAWIDNDGDGSLDSGTDDLAATTTTNASGAFSFNLPGADYVICQVPPVDTGPDPTWFQSFPSNTACAGIAGDVPGSAPAGHVVPVGTSDPLWFFNYQLYGTSIRIGDDADLDGVHDVIAQPLGWTVDLYSDDDADGIVAAGSSPAYSAPANGSTSGGFSSATFRNPGLLPGRYVACLHGRVGFTETVPANAACSSVSAQPGGFPLQAGSGGGGNSLIFLVGPTP